MRPHAAVERWLRLSGLSWTFVRPVNPWDPSRMAGSSSNGSAVVVVTGQVDLALGGGQGGSMRLPAVWSGCVGHKPTHGLVPYTGAFPMVNSIDHLAALGNLRNTAPGSAAYFAQASLPE